MHRHVFNKLRHDSLKSIVLYAGEKPDNMDHAVSPYAKTCALILLHKSKYLIYFSLLENRPRKLSFVIKTKHINSSYDVLVASEMTLNNNSELMIKDMSNGLWLANLNQMKRSLNQREIDLFVEVTYLGPLLGAATSLTVPTIGDSDNTHFLYYYLPRDGAIVRWNFR